MDIEATMKINALAKELVKKGVAATSEEASVLAEEMIHKHVLPREKESVKTEPISEKYEILLERATRNLSRDINSLGEGMTNIIKQLNEIREDIKRLKREQLTEIKKNPEPVIEPKKETKTEKQQKIQPKQNKKEFAPEDVSIDKVFYFGKKE